MVTFKGFDWIFETVVWKLRDIFTMKCILKVRWKTAMFDEKLHHYILSQFFFACDHKYGNKYKCSTETKNKTNNTVPQVKSTINCVLDATVLWLLKFNTKN